MRLAAGKRRLGGSLSRPAGQIRRRTRAARHLVRAHAAAGERSLPRAAGAPEGRGRALRYRDFLDGGADPQGPQPFSDNWIYIHNPSVRVGRIQNFKSWSPEMVPDPAYCCYGLEYFCFEGDGVWDSSDADLIELAKKELGQVGLGTRRATWWTAAWCARQRRILYTTMPTPTMWRSSAKNSSAAIPGLHLVGRNGVRKYNNQDHAMMTAMLTVKNILMGREAFDVWRVNQDAEYHEAGSAAEESSVKAGCGSVPRAFPPEGRMQASQAVSRDRRLRIAAAIAAALLYLAIAIAHARTRAPYVDEAWFSMPAWNLAEHGSGTR